MLLQVGHLLVQPVYPRFIFFCYIFCPLATREQGKIAIDWSGAQKKMLSIDRIADQSRMPARNQGRRLGKCIKISKLSESILEGIHYDS